ncbi:MAG: hypothetical protein B6D61_11795 [Bacteroidetes bacterium 4484_249]|nr:MAG: hypothetical protein B6D61_11795 [Bacteroidetes bacterium 4484_249]
MSKKNQVITELFNRSKKSGNYIFNNETVKEISKRIGVGNPFDVTKLDNTDKFPEILIKNDFYIIHLGNGKHKFINGIKNGFHNFEQIENKNIFEWKYRQSILNEYDTSESNILSVGFNQRIIHDFLYDDIVASPKMYGSRRTKTSLNYKIANEVINSTNIQMEIDLTTEYNGIVTVFEGKNNFPNNFAVYQLYFPFLYFYNLKKQKELNISEINCCYLLRKKQNSKSIIRVYQYTFRNPFDMASIELTKNAQYILVKR